MDIDVEPTTLEVPDITKLENVYGKKIASVVKNIKKNKCFANIR